MSVIYRIRNTLNGDFYIGKTVQRMERRYAVHLANAARGLETHLYRAIRKYGRDLFVCEILENVDDDTILNEREKYWISALSPQYNMTHGGDGGDVSSSPNYIAAIKKRRSFKGCENPMFGKRKQSNPNYGRKRTKEQKKRMLDGIQRAWTGNENRRKAASERVLGFDKNPGAQVNAKRIIFEGTEYISLADASRKTGRSITYIKKTGTFVDDRNVVV